MTTELTVYSRSGCHLCEDMEQQLAELAQEFQFSVRRIDIDDSEKLVEYYGGRVPVLMLENELICEYFLDQQALLNALKSV